MEDILASIRRIIADDQTQSVRPAYGNGGRRTTAGATQANAADRDPARARTPYDDVLDLARLAPSAEGAGTEAADVPAQSQSLTLAAEHGEPSDESDRHDEGGSDESRHGDDESAVSSLRARLPEPVVRTAHPDVQQDTHHGYEGHEDELLSPPLGASVLSAFETLAATVVLQNTPMLERIMRDLLRPMLKTWLDDNLPSLVERLVRTEIERVARGGRG